MDIRIVITILKKFKIQQKMLNASKDNVIKDKTLRAHKRLFASKIKLQPKVAL
jgi:hypothetical protein